MKPCLSFPSIEEMYITLQGTKKDLKSSRHAHAFIIERGLNSHCFLASFLIRMFSSCGSLIDASRAFSHIHEHNVFACSAMILSYVNHGYAEHAVELYYQMIHCNIRSDGHAFVGVIKACSLASSLSDGMLIHSHVFESSFELDIHVCNTLIDMYGRFGHLYDAHNVFNLVPKKDIVTWNSLIGGCSQWLMGQEALQYFRKMQDERIKPDAITLVHILKVCRSQETLDVGKVLHFYIIEDNSNVDAFVQSSLIDMYCKCGSVEDARVIFNAFPMIDVVTWNAIIAGYALNGQALEAMHLFEKMQQSQICPDKITLVNILKVISEFQDISLGKLIHALGIEIACEMDVFFVNSLIDMYAKCTTFIEARLIFDKFEKKDVVSWTAIIAGYSQHGNVNEALKLFHKMQQKGFKSTIITWNAIMMGYAQNKSGDMAFKLFKQMQQEGVMPDCTTFVTILKACCTVVDLNLYKLVHALIAENNENINIFVANTLLDMYTKYGDIKDACKIFWELPIRDLVTWNIMIEGFVECNHSEEALRYLFLVYESGLKPDKVTILSTLKACSIVIAPRMGMLIHDIVIEDSCELDTYIMSSLIDMFSKCGKIEDATRVFDTGPKESIETWNAMVAGCAFNGKYERAMDLCINSGQHGVKPDGISLLCLMSACSHLGAITDGCNYFITMRGECNLRAMREHYNSMIDLCGRVGHLKEAYQVLQTMPLEPDIVSWISLLNHCQIYGKFEFAKSFLDHVMNTGLDKSLAFALKSNFNRDSMLHNSEYAVQHRKGMEVSDVAHTFIEGDQSYAHKSHVNSKLKSWNLPLKSYECDVYNF